MITLSLDALTEFFKSEGLNPKIEEESKQHYFAVKLQEKEVPVFYRAVEKTNVVQLIAYPPSQIKEDTFAEIARFLHILNKELDIPGFGMDESTKLIFYRAAIPSLKNEIEEDILRAYVNTIKNAVSFFFAGITAEAEYPKEHGEPPKK